MNTEMIYSAIRIANEAHRGQVDKAGMPYILHPVRVASDFADEIRICAALLHDVLEDNKAYSASRLLREGISPEVVGIVVLLTKIEGEDYDDYLLKIKSNVVAKNVKAADIRDNSADWRMISFSKETIEYFRNKYNHAREVLEI